MGAREGNTSREQLVGRSHLVLAVLVQRIIIIAADELLVFGHELAGDEMVTAMIIFASGPRHVLRLLAALLAAVDGSLRHFPVTRTFPLGLNIQLGQTRHSPHLT